MSGQSEPSVGGGGGLLPVPAQSEPSVGGGEGLLPMPAQSEPSVGGGAASSESAQVVPNIVPPPADLDTEIVKQLLLVGDAIGKFPRVPEFEKRVLTFFQRFLLMKKQLVDEGGAGYVASGMHVSLVGLADPLRSVVSVLEGADAMKQAIQTESKKVAQYLLTCDDQNIIYHAMTEYYSYLMRRGSESETGQGSGSAQRGIVPAAVPLDVNAPDPPVPTGVATGLGNVESDDTAPRPEGLQLPVPAQDVVRNPPSPGSSFSGDGVVPRGS